MNRKLTKNEERIVKSRVYDKLYTESLAELYKSATEWLEKRNIKEYDIESGNGYKYFTQSGYDPEFDSSVKNTRARADRPNYIVIIKKYSDGSGYNYSGQGVARWSLGNTDHIFNKTYKFLVERNWEDLSDTEYFGYDPNDY